MGRPRIYKSDEARRLAWRTNNKERISETGRTWYKKNRDYRLQCTHKWNRENREYCLANYNRWYVRQCEIRDYLRGNRIVLKCNQACFEAGKLLVKGWSDKEIARGLKCKLRTVKFYIKRLCTEFKVERHMLQRVRLAVKLYQYPIFRGE